jgi:hypothetical protein
MKTVIHVWTHKFNINQEHLKKYNYYNETEFYFGLGDLMRSTIKLYELSKRLNYKLVVDVQLHPISAFLDVQNTQYSQLVKENKNNVDYVCYGGVEDYINESKNNILYILTNDFYDGVVSEDCKIFMKKILTPNELYKTYIDYQISTIPYNNYNILHYRLNDDEFKNKNTNKSEEIIEEKIVHLNRIKEYNDVLITDTIQFKKHVFLKTDVFLFDTKVCHLGLSTDKDAIRDTLFELFLITRASKIKTYCKIHHVSGFVKWISEIYDIPIIIL